MAFTLTTDPIMSTSDAMAALDIADQQQAIMVVNSLSAKLKRFCNRVQINQNTTTAIVERLRPYGGDRLYLHAPIWEGSGFTISAAIYDGVTLADTYTLAGGDLGYTTNDYVSYLTLAGACWPDQTLNGDVRVTYKGGWATVPFDVIQGAIMQGRVDLKRMAGEVGVTSRGSNGESTAYQTAGLIRECLDLWAPYRVVI